MQARERSATVGDGGQPGRGCLTRAIERLAIEHARAIGQCAEVDGADVGTAGDSARPECPGLAVLPRTAAAPPR